MRTVYWVLEIVKYVNSAHTARVVGGFPVDWAAVMGEDPHRSCDSFGLVSRIRHFVRRFQLSSAVRSTSLRSVRDRERNRESLGVANKPS